MMLLRCGHRHTASTQHLRRSLKAVSDPKAPEGWRHRTSSNAFNVTHNYDYTQPTCWNYRANTREFYGPFENIRAEIDFNYHGNYVKPRQQLQDLFISDVVHGGTSYSDPWVVFTAGAMGAGKGHVIKWMSRQGYFTLPDIVQLDPDAFRSRLPEWPTYISRNSQTAGALTHKECGLCVEIAQEAAMRQHKNIWVDGSLRDHIWYTQASAAVVLQRVLQRAAKTGRMVPEAEVHRSLAAVPRSVAALHPMVQFAAEIRNDGPGPPEPVRFYDGWGCRSVCGPTAAAAAWSEISHRFAVLCATADSRRRDLEDVIRAALNGRPPPLASSSSSAAAVAAPTTVGIHFGGGTAATGSTAPMLHGSVEAGSAVGRATVSQTAAGVAEVTVFAKSYCSYCAAVKGGLTAAGVAATIVDLDLVADGVALQICLSRMTGCETTPQVFVRGQFVGGADDALSLLRTGRLQRMLSDSDASPAASNAEKSADTDPTRAAGGVALPA